ncbi:Oidioi.mRNA.OKI2018_I69.chr1.g2110.t1.cds [Oikopleura dioica]|uniref:Oidioi.mRNA.OKI2018_I69.chr1.g2110.t1.cds n=1 Tax=Oikopleura dioica TaxID=34765 RepID=A0ABN7STX7_OIKDI|nr:Oidioi.mRNA.OKI2018_I69.chr1.g2110.t1.cds [Oikopleura dioica]
MILQGFLIFKNPQINNPTYRQCIEEAASSLKKCVTACDPNNACFNACHESFLRTSSNCPCMAKCPAGCPCEDGYNCEPFMTAICEQRSGTYPGGQYKYILSPDGHFKENRLYHSPIINDIPYLEKARYGILNGEVYFFGGTSDNKKIAKLTDCGIEELSVRLLNNFSSWARTVTLPTNPDEIMLCSTHAVPYTKCENFDGQISRNNPFIMNYPHKCGCIALDNNFPTIIDGGDYTAEGPLPILSKVESLGISGWREEQDHPLEIRCPACTSVGDGLITIGGQTREEGVDTYLNDAFLFSNKVWSFAGQIKQRGGLSTLLFYGTHLFNFPGWQGDSVKKVERISWNGTYVTGTTIINEETGYCYRPIVFETLPDACADTCEEYCFP